MISCIIAPEATWKQSVHLPPKPPPPSILDQMDQAIIATLRGHGVYGELVWPLLNEVAETQKALVAK